MALLRENVSYPEPVGKQQTQPGKRHVEPSTIVRVDNTSGSVLEQISTGRRNIYPRRPQSRHCLSTFCLLQRSVCSTWLCCQSELYCHSGSTGSVIARKPLSNVPARQPRARHASIQPPNHSLAHSSMKRRKETRFSLAWQVYRQTTDTKTADAEIDTDIHNHKHSIPPSPALTSAKPTPQALVCSAGALGPRLLMLCTRTHRKPRAEKCATCASQTWPLSGLERSAS